MARPERPYLQFNFLVDLKDSSAPGGLGNYAGGFQEVSAISVDVAGIDYRTGNEKLNSVRKLVGLTKAADVTLKRGVIGTLQFYSWIDAMRLGDQDKMRRQVTITLLSEDRKPVVDWELYEARIIKYTTGPFNAKGNEVAMEEMVLAYENLIMKLRTE